MRMESGRTAKTISQVFTKKFQKNSKDPCNNIRLAIPFPKDFSEKDIRHLTRDPTMDRVWLAI